MYKWTKLTIGLSLPDGVAESEAASDHVEHGDVVGVRRPPSESEQQSGIKCRTGNDDVNAPDVRGSHVTDGHGRDGADCSVCDDDETDLMNSERAVDIGLRHNTHGAA